MNNRRPKPPRFTIYVEEEYGYRYWVWEPQINPKKLAHWWRALKSVEPYSSPASLPGVVQNVRKIRQKEGFWFCHIHTDSDSFLRSPEGEIIHHAGYNPEG